MILSSVSIKIANWVLTALLCSAVSLCHASKPDKLNIAVAANFKPTLEIIIERYQIHHDIEINLINGSTGALFAQIMHQAPFHIFFAADADRPLALEQAKKTRTRQVYAYGRLVLFAPNRDKVNADQLKGADRIAIANPRHAPYGRAAIEVLAHYQMPGIKKIYGSNVAQAFVFVKTGNVEWGMVALSQVLIDQQAEERYMIIPTRLHQPIEQQLVVIKDAPASADDFVAFLATANIRAFIQNSGYLIPAALE
ncbi:MAG: molybdate transport system substrate-binding protein [Candidatus Azotimanducaceae bacterium]|jgi:molybdate transport system substrate-binding protein